MIPESQNKIYHTGFDPDYKPSRFRPKKFGQITIKITHRINDNFTKIVIHRITKLSSNKINPTGFDLCYKPSRVRPKKLGQISNEISSLPIL